MSLIKERKKGYPETEKSGRFFRSTMIDTGSRLRAARGFGKTEAEASAAVFRKLKDRGHPDGPPPTVSDGRGGIREAVAEVYGKVPEYSGFGRRPSKKRPQPDRKYLQMIKERDGKGNFFGIRLKAVYGDLDELIEMLGKSTAYVERARLTMRTFSSRSSRKSIAFSKKIRIHNGCAAIEDMYYNLIRPHKTPRRKNKDGGIRKRIQRTPATAASLTDHRRTLKELFTTVVVGEQRSGG